MLDSSDGNCNCLNELQTWHSPLGCLLSAGAPTYGCFWQSKAAHTPHICLWRHE